MFHTSVSGALFKKHRISNNNKSQRKSISDYPRTSIGSTNDRRVKGSFASTNDRRLTINVSGIKFQTWQSTLLRFPDSLLGSIDTMQQFYDARRKEYFLDRDPYLFKFVLNYYRYGKLHCSQEDCPAAFEEELQYTLN